MNLSNLQTGQFATIQKLQGEDSSLIERLYQLGFLPGEEIEVRRRLGKRGPCLVALGTGQICLSRDESEIILVQLKEKRKT